ncbi:MAG: UDP-N-acetylmuramoyl-L-alanyl-D-glutamate--2,6-diaminopimelate ligase [Bacteroidales bacterium]|jgi:UDP-N-acetylmuramoyl-L-alanyl-D-glutamate--2,6-diaminopimelate ligase|nr:UDP-N-acetylmuramoyl-L-alanyl-D-glutamate--2,6-diaminopimelate ligase [Bacteroidales bacterium]
MYNLDNILKKVKIETIIGSTNKQIVNICFDSRKVSKNYLFVAQKGTLVDGHIFIDKSIENGACVIVCEELPKNIQDNVTYIKVKSSDKALGIISSNFYNNPSSKLKLIGITGTNGKTTTVTLLHNLFTNFGIKTGLISTIVNKINNEEISAIHTTPDAIEINRLLSLMVEAQCQYVFMEVSSHAIIQQRIVGLKFFGGIFSNLTHDHLDYHKTFEAYRDAKKLFFDNLPSTAFCLVNIDDKNGLVMQQNTRATRYTYSLRQLADFYAKIIENTIDGLIMNFNNIEVCTRLIGKFNAYNLLAIYATASLCGIENEQIMLGISMLESVNGRFNIFTLKNGAKAIVDYAHTPDALQNVLSTLTEISRNAKIISVIGCGGNRDKTKRPQMSAIAQKFSNLIIITSDNPRYENPEDIIADMLKGFNRLDNVLTILERASAIKTACTIATKGDIVLIAGKGHETYQEINGIKHHFDDKEEILKYC